jgi:hypothetical protein
VPPERIPKLTRLLVLAWHFERLVRDGVVKDYAEIARRTGLTRARVTQIVNLTLLAPELQATLLDVSLTTLAEHSVDERSLRVISAEPDWSRQQGSLGWTGLQHMRART